MLALQSYQRSLDIRVKLLGEEHPATAKSDCHLAKSQRASGDFLSALQSSQRALDIRVELFGEEHADTAESYFHLGITQYALGNFSLALQSHQCALDRAVKLFERTFRHSSVLLSSCKITTCLRRLFVSTSVLSACSGHKS